MIAACVPDAVQRERAAGLAVYATRAREWCTADPGPFHRRCLERSRVCSAAFHAAPCPGHETELARRQVLERLVLQELVEIPAFDLIQHLVELRVRNALVDEALAAPELGEVPRVMGLELGRHRELPQRVV